MPLSAAESRRAAVMNKRKHPSPPVGGKSVIAPAADDDRIQYVLPPRFAIIAEALVPVVNRLREAMAQDAGLCSQDFVLPESLLNHLNTIQRVLKRLPSRMEELTRSGGVKTEESDIAQVYRAAGRLEEMFSDWVEGFNEVRAAHAQPEFGEVLDLLEGVYRHHLLEVCNWLAELVEIIADPTVAIEKARLSTGESATLNITLTVSVPSQMGELVSLAKRMQATTGSEIDSNPNSQHPIHEGPGVLGTLGALAFGMCVTGAIRGHNHD